MNTHVRLCKPIRSRFVLVGLAALALVLTAGLMNTLPAQSNPAGTAGTAPAAADADSASGQQAAQAKPASPPPAAAGEGFKLGPYDVRTSFEVGYRWTSAIDGNEQMYRSQVNLSDGVRLFNSYLTMRSEPCVGWFDKLDLSINNLGDPYDTVRLNMSRMDAYELRASYRDMNYYNYISSFANPLLGKGNMFPQHNLDVNYRMADFELRLFPRHKIVPFVGYSRNSGSGPGYTTIAMTGDQFLLKTRWDYSADEFRGGVQFNLDKLNLTVEQGYRLLQNHTYLNDAGEPAGNQGSLPYFGKDVTLTSFSTQQNGRVNLPTSKILAKYAPLANLRMIGRYMYTMGDSETTVGEKSAGTLFSLEDFLTYATANDALQGKAKKPNHNGSFLIEYSPFSRITLTDTVNALGYHISGAALRNTLYTDAASLLGGAPSASVSVSDQLDSRYVYNQVRNQAEVEFDLFHGLALRAGHRYTFTDVSVQNDDSGSVSESDMTGQTGIFGLVYRPSTRLRVGFDYENTWSDQPLTRTDLLDYDQFNLDARFGTWKGFSINGRLAVRRNSNDATDIDYQSHDWNFSGGLSWQPVERINLSADYSRSDIYSTILVVIPQNFRTDHSIYDERISAIGGSMIVGLYRDFKAEFGYRGIISRGDNQLEFHQPYASLWIPLKGGLAFKPSWQYFGYSENNFSFENYKTHMATFSLVYTR
jgi:hypothetical protein